MSNAAVFLGGASVSLAAAGALGGDGSIGDPLEVLVDGATITINGSNQLVGASISATDTQVVYMDGTTPSGDDNLTWDKADKSLGLSALATVSAVVDDENNSEPIVVIAPSSGTEAGLVIANRFVDGSDWDGLLIDQDGTNCYVKVQRDGSPHETYLELEAGSGGISLSTLGDIGLSSSTRTIVYSDLVLFDGKSLKTDTTTAHTALIQAYDVNGTAYVTFVTLLNGDVPRCTISQPTGAILALIPPTSDPHVAGAIWNNTGILAISMG